MPLLYSNVPPLRKTGEQQNLFEYFEKCARTSDCIYIAVGYASKNSLLEINRLVKECNVKKIILTLGMYYIEGFPESIYNVARQIDEEWRNLGIGEIRLTKSMKYHGKIYAFYNSSKITSAVIGSHNLSGLVQEANNLRQYEISYVTTSTTDCGEIDAHLSAVISEPVSFSFNAATDVKVMHEENKKLNGVEGVIKVSTADVEAYKTSQTAVSFEIPLKVPGIPGSNQDFMKSNINKCYAKGRLNTKTGVVTERGWWETEIIVSSTTTSNPDYPEKDVPFFVITDDGWKFKMHLSG